VTPMADLVNARRTLHAIAEQLLAGPGWRHSKEISLAVTIDGFITTHSPAPGLVSIAVADAYVIGVATHGEARPIPIEGTLRDLATALELEEPGWPEGVYPDHADVDIDDELTSDPEAITLVLRSLIDGAAALREFDPGQSPVLWPEHFDVAISAGEVNYGVSGGDAGHDEPYAYVGPWTPPETGGFWNESFGAARPVSELGGSAGILAFFQEGRAALGQGTAS